MSNRAKLVARVGELLDAKSFHDREGETWGALLFDWESSPEDFRHPFVAEVFGDCDLSEDFPDILTEGEEGFEWAATSPWLPIGLDNVQDDDVSLEPGDGFCEYPQFDRLLVVSKDDLDQATLPVYAIDVDGTAVPAEAPEPFADDLAAIGFRAAE